MNSLNGYGKLGGAAWRLVLKEGSDMAWQPIEDPLDRTRFPVEPWALSEVAFDERDLGVTETLFAVANGYLGMRANPEEGRVAYEHGTYINGFHETFRIRHAEDAYGFATVGQTMVNVPDAKVIRLYIDDEPLLLTVADLQKYRRTVDFKDGLLRRELVWRAPSGKLARIVTTRMASFTERHLAVMTYEVTVDRDAPVTLSSLLINRQDGEDEYHVSGPDAGDPLWDPRKTETFRQRVLSPELAEQDERDGATFLGYRCTNSGMTVTVGMFHELVTGNEFTRTDTVAPDVAEARFTVRAKAGVPVRLTKLVAYHSSRGVPPAELAGRCRLTLDRAVERGVSGLDEDQRQFLAEFWDRSEVGVLGQGATQQAVRWNLFQALQASARAEGAGIPAKGMTGSGYSGHYFWDSEIYLLPFLTYTTPNLARNALRFRYTMLDAARRRALELSEVGALYPWRTISGEEASAFYAAGTAQYHIDADIAYALTQYLRATNDMGFLEREAIDVLVETARMWQGLGFMRTAGHGAPVEFYIHGVTGPDEYTTVVNDNLFTNVMARFNLRAAARAVGLLKVTNPVAYSQAVARLGLRPVEPAEWVEAADAMHIPYDPSLGIHPQDDQFLQKELWDLDSTPSSKRPLLLHYHPLVIYRFQVLKQTDVVLAQFLCSADFTAEEKLADFDYYDPLTTGDSSLSAVAQAIMAAEVGYQELAQKYFFAALYVDLSNLHGNAVDGVHVASAGGVWSSLVFGFGGLRDSDGRLSFHPRLPELWQGIEFRLSFRGARLFVSLTQEAITFRLISGPSIKVWVRGEAVKVEGGDPVVVPLANQGPRLLGAPTARDITGAVRADGSVITATVPTAVGDTPEANAVEHTGD
jgi:alpha,alpha-trehalose phosphorylase